jgi:lysophospholipase L1-like esterase
MARGGRAARTATFAVLGLLVAGAVAVQIAAAAGFGDRCSGERWVSAWTSPPQDAGGDLHDQSVRTIATVTAPGSALRVTLSNRFGTEPVTFEDVHVGLRLEGPALDPDTVLAVTFDGRAAVDVPPGGEVLSDRVALGVAAGDDLAVSYHVTGPAAVDRHLQSLQTGYRTAPGSGRHAADPGGAAFIEELPSVLGVVAVDVLAPASVGAVAILGDSLTEGVGSTPDGRRSWPDLLAGSLDGRIAVLNAGIGGNHASRAYAFPTEDSGVQDFGPAAADRLRADVLRRSGVTDLVVFVGINDVATQLDDDVVGAVAAAHRRIAAEARAAGVHVIGATLTPASLAPDQEADRRALNEFIRSSRTFDAVVDLGHAVADPDDPTRLLPAYDLDTVHLTDAGYAALAAAFPTSVLEGTGCDP